GLRFTKIKDNKTVHISFFFLIKIRKNKKYEMKFKFSFAKNRKIGINIGNINNFFFLNRTITKNKTTNEDAIYLICGKTYLINNDDKKPNWKGAPLTPAVIK
ncbi:hypothetical protein J7L48_11845, partial [bacterium]|nr:hypothetical protein [bacterium]